MEKVASLLAHKAHGLWAIGPEASVFAAIELMDEKGVGALLVMEQENLLGIISERDYARKVILRNRSSKDTQVKEIMSSDVVSTSPEQPLEQCMSVMTQYHIRHLPVLEQGKVVGMITLGDVVKEIINDQQDKIESLEHSLSWGESY